jgi:Zn-finger protein
MSKKRDWRKRRLAQVKDGEWVRPVETGYLMGCCDCGLVHRMDFRVHKGRAIFRAFRADGHTRVQRKRRNITVRTQ